MFAKRTFEVNKEITLNGEVIVYKLRKSVQAKRARISIASGGMCTCVLPFRVPDSFAEEVLKEKASWIIAKIHEMKTKKVRASVKGPKEEYIKYKKEAYLYACKKLEEYNRGYGYNYQSVRIKNQKTLWGSCSSSGVLNFNYKIVLLPEKLADYVIVHELCHLKEFNHSERFWNLVAKTIPNHAALRKELARYGMQEG